MFNKIRSALRIAAASLLIIAAGVVSAASAGASPDANACLAFTKSFTADQKFTVLHWERPENEEGMPLLSNPSLADALKDAEQKAFEIVEQAQREAAGLRASAEGDAAAVAVEREKLAEEMAEARRSAAADREMYEAEYAEKLADLESREAAIADRAESADHTAEETAAAATALLGASGRGLVTGEALGTWDGQCGLRHYGRFDPCRVSPSGRSGRAISRQGDRRERRPHRDLRAVR